MKKYNLSNIIALATLCCGLGLPATAAAIPVLQVGAPAGPADSGIYADYFDTLSSPTEEDTAVTTGTTLYAAGAYKHDELLLGGQYEPESADWSDFGLDAVFNGHGAVLMATVADGTLASGSYGLSIDIVGDGNGSILPFHTMADDFSLIYPNSHDPIKNQDYLFFDIGDFAKTGAVPNFDESETDTVAGEIKEIMVPYAGLGWVHFDLMALTTTYDNQTFFTSTLEVNPGSHDLTMKPVPEPATMVLFGTGLAALAGGMRRRRSSR